MCSQNITHIMETSPFNLTEIMRQYYNWEMTMPNAASFGVLVSTGALAVLALWRVKKWRRGGGRRRSRRPLLKRSTSLGLLHGGGMALQRLLEYHQARADAEKLDIADCEFRLLLTHEQPDFHELTRVASKLEMSGKEDHAIEMLEVEIHKAHQNTKWHEKYELEMLLVEMYIYKGDYKKALDLKCLTDENMSDARRPLFMMIILLVEEGDGKEDKAETFWHEFCELRTSFSCQPAVKAIMEEAGVYQSCAGFQEFKKLVQILKEDIQKAKGIRNLAIF